MYSNRIPPNFIRPANSKFIYLTDVLDNESRLEAADMARENISDNDNYSRYFFPGDNKVVDILINKARTVFDLTACQYYEMWSNDHALTMHIDMEPTAWRREQQVITPMCTLVYYPEIKLESGGKFLTDDVELVPVENSMVIFSPGVYHGVEPFVGTRLSLAINPIDRPFTIQSDHDLLKNKLKKLSKKVN